MNTSHARILVPVDYSDDSRVAAATAFRLAAPEGDVALVHVSPRPANDVVDEVCARAVDWPADMIVVGTHCEPGSVRFLLGSVTAELSRRAPCPVLVTRSGPDRGPRGRYRNILVAIDYSPVSLPAAELAATLVAGGGAVTLLHVWSSASPSLVMPFTGDRQQMALQRLERLAERLQVPRGVIVDALVDVGSPAPRILAQAERMRADLVVVGAHARSGMVENVIGTVADRVLRHAHGPVLLVPRC